MESDDAGPLEALDAHPDGPLERPVGLGQDVRPDAELVLERLPGGRETDRRAVDAAPAAVEEGTPHVGF